MPKTEAAIKAQHKYAQSEKGKTAIRKAKQKHASTDEYRAYQREKQREYRQRKKFEAREGTPAQSELVAEASPATKAFWVRLPVDIDEILRSLPNPSEFIGDAVIKALREEGLLPDDQDSGNRGAA